MANSGNHPPKLVNGKPAKPAKDYLLGLIRKTAAAFSVGLTEETQAVYLEYLSGYSADKLEYAINRTIQEWTEAHKMPTPNFILTRCIEYSSRRSEALDRPDKPPDWDPRFAKELLAAVREANPGRKVRQG